MLLLIRVIKPACLSHWKRTQEYLIWLHHNHIFKVHLEIGYISPILLSLLHTKNYSVFSWIVVCMSSLYVLPKGSITKLPEVSSHIVSGKVGLGSIK